MKRAVVIALLLALAIGMLGCVKAKLPDPLGAAPMGASSPDSATLAGAKAVNAFGFDLLRSQLATNGNVVLSPLSVHAALSMTLQGARGRTAAEMQRVLHLSGDADSAASIYSLLLDALDNRSKEQTLTVANALWVEQGLAVKREFLNSNRISFGATVRTLDFGQTDVAGVVNQWVSEHTRGMINKIISKVDPRAVMLLANAIYFKADWALPFAHALTRPEPFRLASGETTSVPMMHATLFAHVVQTATFSAARLDYRGGDSAAYLILPAQGQTLASVLSALNAADFAKLRARVDSQPTTPTALALPKFDVTVGGGIKEVLTSMGMPTAFDADKADFRAMATPPFGQNIWIGDVIHKARMKVDETGTEAAAATVVEMFAGAAPVRQNAPLPFVCDHPFAIVLVDRRTGALLFLAAINNPVQH